MTSRCRGAPRVGQSRRTARRAADGARGRGASRSIRPARSVEKWTEAGGAAKVGAPTSGDEVGAGRPASATSPSRRARSSSPRRSERCCSTAPCSRSGPSSARRCRASWARRSRMRRACSSGAAAPSGSRRSRRVRSRRAAAAAFEVHGRIYERWRALERCARPARLADLRRGDRGARRSAGVHASPAATSTGRAAPTLPPRSRRPDPRQVGSARRRRADCSATRSPTRRP